MGFIDTSAALGTQLATAGALDLSRALLTEQRETNRLLRKLAGEVEPQYHVSHVPTTNEKYADLKAERQAAKAERQATKAERKAAKNT